MFAGLHARVRMHACARASMGRTQASNASLLLLLPQLWACPRHLHPSAWPTSLPHPPPRRWPSPACTTTPPILPPSALCGAGGHYVHKKRKMKTVTNPLGSGGNGDAMVAMENGTSSSPYALNKRSNDGGLRCGARLLRRCRHCRHSVCAHVLPSHRP